MRLAVVFPFLAGVMSSDPIVAQPQPGRERVVADAATEMEKTSGYWNPLGSAVLKARYTIGWAASPGYGYLLLSSPAVAIALGQGGLLSAGTMVAKDGILAAARSAIRVPRTAAASIAAAERESALADYERAYAIARKYVKTAELTQLEAQRFLDLRWSILRLEAAGRLKAETNRSRSATERALSASAHTAVEQLFSRYSSAGQRTIKLVEAAMFMNELYGILQEAGVGLGGFKPYRDYRQQLSEIEHKREAERASWITRDNVPTAEAMSELVARFRNSWRTAVLVRNDARFRELFLPDFLHTNTRWTHSDYGSVFLTAPEVSRVAKAILQGCADAVEVLDAAVFGRQREPAQSFAERFGNPAALASVTELMYVNELSCDSGGHGERNTMILGRVGNKLYILDWFTL